MKREKIKFPENVQVEKIYTVPCIKTLAGEYVPINSYLHEDKKIIGAAFKHWHIDWRFASVGLWNEEVKWRVDNTVQTRSIAEVGYALFNGKKYKGNDALETMSAIDTKIYYKKRKCKRDYGAANFFRENMTHPDSWVDKLAAHFCGSSLKADGEKLICPHKGVVIDKNCKDHNGNYVCPAHLLRFHPKTLKCIQ